MIFRKFLLIGFLILIKINLFSQKLGIDYRTATDSLSRMHYLNFKKDGTISIRFQNGPGVYWGNYNPTIYRFSKNRDTIRIMNLDSVNISDSSKVLLRILNSKFVVKPNGQLYDLNSGFTYVNKNSVKRMKYGAISIDDKIYLLKKNGRSYLLRRKIKRIDLDLYKSNLIVGKPAFDKYGLKGINGVIEIKKK
jgi:hypothetical protein